MAIKKKKSSRASTGRNSSLNGSKENNKQPINIKIDNFKNFS